MGKTLDELFGEEAQQPAAENPKRRGFELLHGQADPERQQVADHGYAPARRRGPQAVGGLKGRNFLTVPPRRAAQPVEVTYEDTAPAADPYIPAFGATALQVMPAAVTYEPSPMPPQVGEVGETPAQAALADVESFARSLPSMADGGPLPRDLEVAEAVRQLGEPSEAAAEALEQITDWQQAQAPKSPIDWSEGIGPQTILDSISDEQPFCYISGPAGTGKTTLARALLEDHGSYGRMVLCATTGIAAVNLGAKAQTINALLGYFSVEDLVEKHARMELQPRLRRAIKGGLEYILLDEVSMLSAAAVSILVQVIEEVNSTAEYDREMAEFRYGDGGKMGTTIKLIIVGDFAQLPPVDAPYAFESPEWDRFARNTFKLEKVWRQDDLQFVHALQAVRRGKPLDAIGTLRPCFVPAVDMHFEGTTIVGQNKEVDALNMRRHQALPGEPIRWDAVKSGEQHKDWKQIPDVVAFKPGALVMILMNRRKEDPDEKGYEYVNGDQGHVIGIEEIPADADTPDSKPHRLGYRVKLLRDAREVVVIPVTKEWTEPVRPPIPVAKDYVPKPGETIGFKEIEDAKGQKTTQKCIVKTQRGAVTYMPLRLAYATTVHKSQGLSLDKVQVIIANWMFTKPGMMYVALSRARNLQGLRIVGTEKMFMSRCAVDPKIQAYV